MKVWQTFGRLRLRLDQSIQRGRNFSSCFDQVYADRNGYAFCEVTGDGAWGSNPHAPTKILESVKGFLSTDPCQTWIWQTPRHISYVAGFSFKYPGRRSPIVFDPGRRAREPLL
jgi:hypothetical protein